MFTYLPPYGSTTYGSDEENGVLHLEKYLNQIESKYPDTGIMISGDLNARIKDLHDYIIDDSTDHLPLPSSYVEDIFEIPRNTQDKHGEVNRHGKELLRLCRTHDIHLLNGRTPGDTVEHLTCFTANGCSTVDYTLASSALFSIMDHYEIGEADEFTHLPQTIRIRTRDEPVESSISDTPEEPTTSEQGDKTANQKRTRWRWTPKSFEAMISSEHIKAFNDSIDDNNVDDAIQSLNLLVQEACSIKTVKGKNDHAKSEWWDNEMNVLKYQKYKCLRDLRLNPSSSALIKYRSIRKLYKSKIKEKKD